MKTHANIHVRVSRFGAAAAAVAALLAHAAVVAGDGKVTLTGGEETPPVATAASGNGTITIKEDRSVSGHVTTRGIAGTAAHIHVGAAGKSGPPIITLTQQAENEWVVPEGAKLTEEQYKSYLSGELYVNIHSAAHGPGEIRAQLQP